MVRWFMDWCGFVGLVLSLFGIAVVASTTTWWILAVAVAFVAGGAIVLVEEWRRALRDFEDRENAHPRQSDPT